MKQGISSVGEQCRCSYTQKLHVLWKHWKKKKILLVQDNLKGKAAIGSLKDKTVSSKRPSLSDFFLWSKLLIIFDKDRSLKTIKADKNNFGLAISSQLPSTSTNKIIKDINLHTWPAEINGLTTEEFYSLCTLAQFFSAPFSTFVYVWINPTIKLNLFESDPSFLPIYTIKPYNCLVVQRFHFSTLGCTRVGINLCCHSAVILYKVLRCTVTNTRHVACKN